ncbi:MAG: hypothetical protein ACLVJX_09875 [Merdibacter sp.]
MNASVRSGRLFSAGASEEDELLRQTAWLCAALIPRGEPEEVSAMYGHVADMLCKKITWKI